MDVNELVTRVAPHHDPQTRGLTREVIQKILDADLSIVSLRQAGWQSTEDHSLIELDGDEDYVPPNSVPVWQVGTTALGVPALDFLEDDDD